MKQKTSMKETANAQTAVQTATRKTDINDSPFATDPIGKLIARFAIPCVISLAFALLIGDGGASYLSLRLGEGDNPRPYALDYGYIIAIILPVFLGVEGVLYAGPVADGLAFALALVLVFFEIKHLNRDDQPSTQTIPDRVSVLTEQ